MFLLQLFLLSAFLQSNSAAPVPPAFSSETPDELADYELRIDTSMGEIFIELFPLKAPNHVRHMLRLASEGVFDQTAVSRAIPGLGAEFGDIRTRRRPLTPRMEELAAPVMMEPNDLRHTPGAVSMAFDDTGGEDDGTSFIIMMGREPSADLTSTVFGHVTRSARVVQAILEVPASEDGVPLRRIEVYSIQVYPKP